MILLLPQDIFEAVKKAYEFLCSTSAKRTEGPDPHRIVLLLRTPSILFKRYADGQPFLLALFQGCAAIRH